MPTEEYGAGDAARAIEDATFAVGIVAAVMRGTGPPRSPQPHSGSHGADAL